ncbi:MAG TPA: hypothetical protein VGD23_01360 [Sphingomicrobium sp.]
MRSNQRLQRALAIRQLGGAGSASIVCPEADAPADMVGSLRLFALTFAGGFLFTSIFIA